jgi:hypothetical protein
MLQLVFVGRFFYFVKNLQFWFYGNFQNSKTSNSSSLIFLIKKTSHSRVVKIVIKKPSDSHELKKLKNLQFLFYEKK